MASATSLGRDLGVYRRLVGARIRSEWQYRTSFVSTTVLSLIAAALDFVTIAVIFRNVPVLEGWTLAEAALLYGMAGTAHNLGDIFISQVELIHFHVRDGTFDQFLIRPMRPMLQLCAQEFAYRRITKVAQSILVLVIAALAVDIAWTPGRLGLLVGGIGTGLAIWGAIWVLVSSLAFWAVNTQELVYSTINGGHLLTQYPLDVFSEWLRRFATVTLPVAFVAYFPALAILGKPTPDGVPDAARFMAPVVAVVLVTLASVVWRAGLRAYRSTGS